MTLNYKHQQGSPRCTIVIESLPKETLQEMVLSGHKYLNIAIGISRVHPIDQYNKKIGRQRALELTTTKIASLIKATPCEFSKRTTYHFEYLVPNTRLSVNLKTTLYFGFSVVKESTNTHLEYAYIEELNE